MTTLNHRYPAVEGEEEYELEGEFENEFEDEFEDEQEDEYEAETEAEFEFEFEAEAEAYAEAELEDEFEAEAEEEGEGFVNPVRRIYRDAELMAHLSSQAAQTESEQEAEAFIGALVPLASRLIPRAASLITRNAPTLIRGVNRITSQLRRDPTTRKLVRTLPVILQRTAQSLADQSADGVDLGADDVLGTLGRIAGRVLTPADTRSALRAVNVFDRRYRRRAQWQRARGTARPVGRMRYPRSTYARSTYARSGSDYRSRRNSAAGGSRRARRY